VWLVCLSLWLGLASSACGVYSGSATTLQAKQLQSEAGWLFVEGVPELHQHHELDCGPTALAMLLGFYGAENQQRVLALLPERQRISVTQLRDVAKQQGFEAFVVEGKPDDLVYELKQGRPAIVGMAKPTVGGAVAHYEVVIGMNRGTQRVATLDPAVGLRQNSFSGFLSEWQATGRVLLVVVPKRMKAGPEPVEDTHATQSINLISAVRDCCRTH
jgi:ABC-type bacteriocin/lantibiotic exporter with double-glycine peptidase domain